MTGPGGAGGPDSVDGPRFHTGPLGPFSAAFIKLAMLASAAHDQFVFGAPEEAHAFYEVLLRSGGADFAPPAGRLLLVAGRPAGMFALVPSPGLTRIRLRGALAFVRSRGNDADERVAERLHQASSILFRTSSDDGYLSRLAVDPSLVGRGWGDRLLAEALQVTQTSRLRRCVLEVADTNHRAIALYMRAGFEEVDHKEVTDQHTGASLGYLHLVRQV